MNRRSPWVLVAFYVIVVAALLVGAYMWKGVYADTSAVSVLFLTAWMLWLSVDRSNVLDYAEQAADSADQANRRYDELADTVNKLIDYLEDREAEPHPVTEPIPVQPATVPMAQAWDTSAAQLVENEAPQTRVHTREFDGRTFQFRA